ncbi:MAG: rhomboid family intramembrane serine protease, partial [Bacteroidia bacterium]
MSSTSHTVLRSSLFPMAFLLLAWFVFYIDIHYKLELHAFGLEPRTLKGLLGLFTMPLLHADLRHIVYNSIPLFILGTLLFYFYREIAIKVFFITYFACGALVWLFARGDSSLHTVHIGASGLIYGLSGFLFFSGIIRKHRALFGVSLLVTFLYGSVIWGVFPVEFQQAIHYIEKKENISWEGHLFGFLSGTVLAYAYRKTGIQ